MNNIKMKDIPNMERPREKFIKLGKENLSDHELLMLLLKTGTKDKSVNILCYEILNDIGCIDKLKNVDYSTLLKYKGIGMTKAIDLLVAVELGKRIFLKNSDKIVKLNSSSKIFEYVRYLLHDKKQEHFYCLYLDFKKNLIVSKLLFVGTLNRSVVHPREIFKEAYLVNAAYIICVHNHPSGDLKASSGDIHFTKVLLEISHLQGIVLLDHLIVSNDAYYSFYDDGKLL